MFKRYSWLLILLVISMASFAQNYTILGGAVAQSGCNCYQLTPDANDRSGAIFQNNTINLNNSFDYTFELFLGCNGSGGADGFTFTLTNNPNGLGTAGGGLGYAGGTQPFSLAVEYDTWQNGAPANDPAEDHIGIESAGNINHNVAAPVPALSSGANIDDCQTHTTRIVWDVNTSTYSVYFDGVLRLTYVNPNIVADFFGGNPIVNWGWTASTGGGSNEQNVCIRSISTWTAGVNYQSCDLTMQFTDISTSNVGTVQSWLWNFGDGSTSTQQNPSHTYAATDTYNVSLTITDITGCTYSFSHPVTINPPISQNATLANIPCNGGANGSITLAPTGGFGASAGYGGYRFIYDGVDFGSGSSYVGRTAGTYQVEITDGVCTTIQQYTLTQPTAITATTSHTDASCGQNNGTATITITGGTPPYQGVSWAGIAAVNTGGTTYVTSNRWPYPAHIADFRDANGCSALLQYRESIGQTPCGISSSVVVTNVTCYGFSTGGATLSVTGGAVAPPQNVAWSNGQTGFTLSNVPAGTYNYTYSDANGANTFSGQVIITQPAAPIAVSLTTINASCNGTNDGVALASVTSGGSQQYTYAWSGGQNTPSVSGLSPGNISITVTDANLCSATASATITGPPPFVLNVTGIDDSCYQSKTGSTTADISGGNPPYTFYWNNISSAQTNIGLGAGTYQVTVTDSKNCTVSGSVSIGQPAAPVGKTVVSQNINCFGQATGSIAVTPSGGTPGYTYTWNPSGVSGGNPTGLTAGKYVFTVADVNGCSSIDSVTLTEPATALNVVASHTNVTCYNANDGTLTVTVNGGTPPYFYRGNPIPAGTNTLPGLPPGVYADSVKDNNGCFVLVNETITGPGPQSLDMFNTDEICNGGTSAYATAEFINATGSVTYNWSNNQTGDSLPNLPAGTYIVTATDANLCVLVDSVTITEPPAPVMTTTIVDAACFGGNGSVTANPVGGGSFTYVWSGGTATTQTVQLPAGNYSVTATDANLCRQTAAFTVNEAPEMIVQETLHTDIGCNGDSSGVIQLATTGGTGPNYTYNWTYRDVNGNITPNFNNTDLAQMLKAGDYYITITDQANCTKVDTVTLTQPALPLTFNYTASYILCYGQSNGSIILDVSGGTPGYIYTWNPNISNNDSALNLLPGNYSVTVADANGCTQQLSTTISQPSQPLALDPSFTNLTCFESNDGTATVIATGGTIPYRYSWSPNISDTTNSAVNLPAATYTVQVTDNNGCINDTTFTITQPLALTTSETHVDVLCFGDSTGAVFITANQGTPGTTGYTYTWSPNVSSNDSAVGIPAGTYTIVVTDSNGCTASQIAVVTEPPLLVLNVGVENVKCSGESTGFLNATASGGFGAYNFTYTPGGPTALPAGFYTVNVTDAHGCIDSVTVEITEPLLLEVGIDTVPVSCKNYADGSITITPSGGTPGYTFTSSTGETNTNGVFNGLEDGTYTITVTDAVGCTLTDAAIITEPDSVLISVTPTPVEVKLGETLQLSTTINLTGNVTYEWTPDFGLSCTDCSNPVFNGIYSQPYLVIATTDNGCRGTAEFVVTVVPFYEVFFPNVFTPNADGTNDFWQMYVPDMDAIKQIEVNVFNRIGEKVYQGTDINYKWDGTFKGVNAPGGVYTYTAKIVWINNHSDNNYKGTITLLR